MTPKPNCCFQPVITPEPNKANTPHRAESVKGGIGKYLTPRFTGLHSPHETEEKEKGLLKFSMITETDTDVAIPPQQQKAMRDEISKMADEVYREESKARDKLTRKQFRYVLAQAIASGDFMTHVRVSDGAQMVTYLPFREVEMLKARIGELERLIHEHAKV